MAFPHNSVLARLGENGTIKTAEERIDAKLNDANFVRNNMTEDGWVEIVCGTLLMPFEEKALFNRYRQAGYHEVKFKRQESAAGIGRNEAVMTTFIQLKIDIKGLSEMMNDLKEFDHKQKVSGHLGNFD